MPVEKIDSKTKTRQLYVVYFGSEENADFPSDTAYQDFLERAKKFRPEDISAMPMIVIGDKAMRLKVERIPYVDGARMEVSGTRSRRSPVDLEADKFIKRARVQYELFVDGKMAFVFTPFYSKIGLVNA